VPDYAPNYTARYRFHYSSGGFSHSMTVRLAAGTDMSDVTGISTKMGAVLDTIADGGLYTDWTILTAEAVGSDDDAFLPCAAPPQPTGTSTLTGTQPSDFITSLCFPGRSVNGGRARLFLYGNTFGHTFRTGSAAFNDFRLLGSEFPAIGDFVAALNELSPALVANDNGTVIWYNYADVKINDRWVRRLRRG
jgi:hypothetical protein